MALVLSVNATPAAACSCAVLPSNPNTAGLYPVVFVGRVDKITPSNQAPDDLVTVRLVTLTGGMSGDQYRSVETTRSGVACGYTFTTGATYEVHARTGTSGALMTDACSGTHPTTRAVPAVGYPTDPMPNRIDVRLVAALAVLGFATVVGLATIVVLLSGRK